MAGNVNIWVIDDERIPAVPEGIDVVLIKNSRDALDKLEVARVSGGKITQLWLDYSLGGGGTIEPVLDWLVTQAGRPNPLEIDLIFAHTTSSSGRKLIAEWLAPTDYQVVNGDLPQ